MDIKQTGDEWKIHSHGGSRPTEFEAIAWAKRMESLGAGEILLTSMDHDGTKAGFAIDITRTISNAVSIPVIASGGAGGIQHFEEVFAAEAAENGDLQ